jgi:transcription elongation factor Elf1
MLNSLPACIVCGHSYARKRRNLIQKVLFQAVFRCEHCGHETYIRRGSLLFVMFRRYSECPWCGNPDVSRLSSRDRVDPMSRNPLRRILGLLGFPLYPAACSFSTGANGNPTRRNEARRKVPSDSDHVTPRYAVELTDDDGDSTKPRRGRESARMSRMK